MVITAIVAIWFGLGALLCVALCKAVATSMPRLATRRRRRAGEAESGGALPIVVRWTALREWQGEASLCVFAALAAPLGAGQQVTLAWDPSFDASVTGYKVCYHGTGSTNVTILDVGNTTVCTLTNLCESDTFSFSVTAYNEFGLESDPSNTVDYTVPLGRLDPAWTTDGEGHPVMQFFVNGVEGKSLALQSSTNLVDWATLVTASPGEQISWSVTNCAISAARFYRSLCLP
jgi:hypothetical protein